MGGLDTRSLIRKLQFCEHCGFCRSVCTFLQSADMEESVGPRGKKTLFIELFQGRIKPSPRLAEKFYMCGVCSACAIKCPQGIDIADVSVHARHEIIKAGALPPFMKKITDMLVEGVAEGDIFGGAATKASWTEGLRLNGKSDTILFASCMDTSMAYGELLVDMLIRFGWAEDRIISASSSIKKMGIMGFVDKFLSRKHDFYRRSLVNTAKLLQMLGINFSYMGSKEPCCGAALHTYGLLDEFAEQAKKVYKQLKEMGVRRIIIHNPICGGIFKREYPSYVDGWDIETMHVTEVIAEAISNNGIDLSYPYNVKVVFHDPCYLARFMYVIEAPRKILKSIDNVEYVEPVNSGKETKCCGGGGVELIYRDVALKAASNRVLELTDKNPDIVSSICPVCALMIKKGIKATNKRAEYLDLVDLVAKSIKTR